MKETPFLEARDEMLSQFKSIPFLSSFVDVHLKKILNSSKIRIYSTGENIIQEGERDRWVYVLMSGEVSVSKRGGHLTQFNTAGDVFGEMSLVTVEPRSASVTAHSPVTCLAIDGNIIGQVGAADQAVFLAVIYRLLFEVVVQRLRTCSDDNTRMKLEIDMLKANLIMTKN